MTLTALSAGVDALYLSFRGVIAHELVDTLEQLKSEAQESGERVPIFLVTGHPTTVQASGWGHYRYWLRGRDVDIFVAKGEKLPPAYVRISSQFCRSVGPELAAAEAEVLVRGLVVGQEAAEVSRIDLCSDFQGWIPGDSDYSRFVTRSSRNSLHREHARTYFEGRVFTGFQFGRGALVARLYDKTRELDGTEDECWLRELWGSRLSADEPVWRLEFQFRREVLRDFNLHGVNEVLACRQDLWSYATKWLSLRLPSTNRQRTRWPVAAEWRQLQRVAMTNAVQGVIRRRVTERSELVLIRGLAGYLSSLAAARGIRRFDEALQLTGRLIPTYLAERDQDFAKVAHAKHERLLRHDLPWHVRELVAEADEALAR